MDPFHVAQSRFAKNGSWGVSESRYRDYLQTYKPELFNTQNASFERALQFRHQEKERYKNLEQENAVLRQAVRDSTANYKALTERVQRSFSNLVAREHAHPNPGDDRSGGAGDQQDGGLDETCTPLPVDNGGAEGGLPHSGGPSPEHERPGRLDGGDDDGGGGGEVDAAVPDGGAE